VPKREGVTADRFTGQCGPYGFHDNANGTDL